VAASAISDPAHANDYTNRTIKIIVSTPPGAAIDVMACRDRSL